MGVNWYERRASTTWIALLFRPDDEYAVRTGPADADEPYQEVVTDNYTQALEALERLATRT